MATIVLQVSDKSAEIIKEAVKDASDLKETLCEAFTEITRWDISGHEEPQDHDNIRAALFEFSKLITALVS